MVCIRCAELDDFVGELASSGALQSLAAADGSVGESLGRGGFLDRADSGASATGRKLLLEYTSHPDTTYNGWPLRVGGVVVGALCGLFFPVPGGALDEPRKCEMEKGACRVAEQLERLAVCA